MSPGKESHSSFSVPLIPGDMSPRKGIPSDKSPGIPRIYPNSPPTLSTRTGSTPVSSHPAAPTTAPEDPGQSTTSEIMRFHTPPALSPTSPPPDPHSPVRDPTLSTPPAIPAKVHSPPTSPPSTRQKVAPGKTPDLSLGIVANV
ncbi:hypothetical protein Tco_1276899 [Tanacetum coccineum]